MSAREENQKIEFEIKLENYFFYQTVLPWLTSNAHVYQAEGITDGVILRSVRREVGLFYTVSEINEELTRLLQGQAIKPYLFGDPARSLPRYAANRETTAAMAPELLRQQKKGVRLYENYERLRSRAEVDTRFFPPKGRLPYMAYYCAVDGFVVTHVSQAFFCDYANAADALAVMQLSDGFGAVYVCIDDRSEGGEEAENGIKGR